MGASLTSIRQYIGQELGRFVTGTNNSSGGTTTTAVDTQLVSSLSISDWYVDWHYIIPAASAADDRVSRLVTTFAPSTGTITVDRAWSASSIADSAVYEMHGYLEPWTDLPLCINDALSRLYTVVELTVTPTANAIRHDLTTSNTWLTDPKYVRQVGYLVTGETRANVDPFARRRVYGYTSEDSGIVYLNHPTRTFASNETIYLRVLKPAYAHCRTNSAASYGSVTTGLSAEANETAIEKEVVGAGAIVCALNRNLLMIPKDENTQLMETLDRARRRWTDWCAVYDARAREDGRLTLRRAPVLAGVSWQGYR